MLETCFHFFLIKKYTHVSQKLSRKAKKEEKQQNIHYLNFSGN